MLTWREPPLSASEARARRGASATHAANKPNARRLTLIAAILFGRVCRPQGVAQPRGRPSENRYGGAVDSRSTTAGSEPRTCERVSRPSSSATRLSTAAAPSSLSGIAIVVTGGAR